MAKRGAERIIPLDSSGFRSALTKLPGNVFGATDISQPLLAAAGYALSAMSIYETLELDKKTDRSKIKYDVFADLDDMSGFWKDIES